MDNLNSNSPFLTSNGRKTITRDYGNKTIEFELYTKEEADKLTDSGIYIFLNFKHHSIDIYIGQSKDFSTRIPSHDRWEEAKNDWRADCVAIAKIGKDQLDAIEKFLIQDRKPILNEQFNESNQDTKFFKELNNEAKRYIIWNDR